MSSPINTSDWLKSLQNRGPIDLALIKDMASTQEELETSGELIMDSPLASDDFSPTVQTQVKARVSEPGSANGSISSSDHDDPKASHAELLALLQSKSSELSSHLHAHAKEFVAEVLLSSLGLQDAAIIIQHIKNDRWMELNKSLSVLLSNFLNDDIVPEVEKHVSGSRTPVSTLGYYASSPQNTPASELTLSNATRDVMNNLSWVTRSATPLSAPRGNAPAAPEVDREVAGGEHLPGQWLNQSETADQFNGVCANAGSIIHALSSASPESQREFAELLGQVSKQLSTDPTMLLLHLESLSTSVQASNIFDELAPSVRDKILNVCEKCAPYIKVEHFDSGVRHWLVQIQSLFGEVHAISSLEALEQAANLEGIRKMKAFITTRLIDHYEHLVWAQDPQVYARGKLQPDMYLMLCELIHSKKGLCWSHFDPKVLDAMREVRGIDAVRLRLQKLCLKELAGVTNVPAYLYTLLNKRSLVGMQYVPNMPQMAGPMMGFSSQIYPSVAPSHADHRPRGHARTAAAATARTTRARIFESTKAPHSFISASGVAQSGRFPQYQQQYDLVANNNLGSLLMSGNAGYQMGNLNSLASEPSFWNPAPVPDYASQPANAVNGGMAVNSPMWTGWL